MSEPAITNAAEKWTDDRLDAVADGSSAMSQRKLSSVEQRGGGVEAARRAAQEKDVHLLVLKDDRGDTLIAASAGPFTGLC